MTVLIYTTKGGAEKKDGRCTPVPTAYRETWYSPKFGYLLWVSVSLPAISQCSDLLNMFNVKNIKYKKGPDTIALILFNIMFL